MTSTSIVVILFSGLVQLALSLIALAHSYGKLSQKVDVLWLAVFNHLGQDAEEVSRQWQEMKNSKQ